MKRSLLLAVAALFTLLTVACTGPAGMMGPQGLAERRIATVRDALIRAGVSADRIETGTFAMQRASCKDTVERCSQRDGRVEVLVRNH